MQKETKNYAIVTYLCRGSRYQEVSSRVDGVRLLDWIRSGAVTDERAAAGLADQLIRVLRCRALSGSRVMRGHADPYVFVVDDEARVHLLDLEDESNQAVVRKIQTASVMRYFTPEGFPTEDCERAEVYGFARTMQFALESGPAGRQMGRAVRSRWRRLLDRCVGDGFRAFRDFDRVQRAFRSVQKTAPAAQRGHSAGARRKLLVAVCVLSTALLLKKGVYDQAVYSRAVQREQTQMTDQLRRMEDRLDRLSQEQQKLELQVKKQ